MSADEMVPRRNAGRATRTALCQWERTAQGSLRATWRPSWRVASAADTRGPTPEAVVQSTRDGQRVRARARSDGNARQRPIDRWIAAGFIGALYLLVAFAGLAIVVRV